jgi:prevent-host-death family protein
MGIRHLQAHPSAYLRKAEAGETVYITKHGKPIGRLVPAMLDQYY